MNANDIRHLRSSMNPAAHCRAQKQKHPELYCPHPKCLWRIVTNRGPNPCRNHQQRATQLGDGKMHTLAPWITVKHEEHVSVQSFTLNGSGDYVAEVYSAADAQLIAAAPELLAALREIIAINDETPGEFRKRGGTRRGLSIVTARAAIAKAESREMR